MAWTLSIAIVALALVCSVLVRAGVRRRAAPGSVIQHIGFVVVQAVAIYAAMAYLAPLLHAQGSGAHALAGAFGAAATVPAQLLFGRRRA